MRTLSRVLAAGAAIVLTAGLAGGCARADSPNDRRYCLDTQVGAPTTEQRVADDFCVSPGEPRYAWVWVERSQYIPVVHTRPGYRYYRYPVDRRGQRVQGQPVADTIRPATPRATAAAGSARPTSTRTTDARTTTRPAKTKGPTTRAKGSTSNGSKSKGSGSKRSSGSKGSSGSKSKR